MAGVIDLWARINGHDYAVAMGASFTDELNETLDSGTITLPHVSGDDLVALKDLRPYDDVVVYSGAKGSCPDRPYGAKVSVPEGKFYRHMIVDKWTSRRVNLVAETEDWTIDLFSETKGLETIVLPNTRMTRPKEGAVLSVYDQLKRVVELRSPWEKYTNANNTWTYRRKYVIDSDLQAIFGSIPCPEIGWTNPTLREVLNGLMLTADRIAIVRDNVITSMSVADRTGEFSPYGIGFVTGGMDSASYTDTLRTNYEWAVTRDGCATMVEYIGYRDPTKATMEMSDWQLTTTHRIYDVKKVEMIYPKSVGGYTEYSGGGTISEAYKNEKADVLWVHQDITPLVLQEEVRNALSRDWTDLNELDQANAPKTIEELAQYKFATLGWQIGQTFIQGFGDTYSYPQNFLWDARRSYIENILRFMDEHYPLGNVAEAGDPSYILSKDVYANDLSYATGEDAIIAPFDERVASQGFPSGFYGDDGFVTDLTLKLKALVFKVEYSAMMQSSVVSGREYHDGHVRKLDYPSYSIPMTESNGAYLREKANRLGNKSECVTSYVPSEHIFDTGAIAELGTAYGDDMVVFKRAMTFRTSGIHVDYYASKDYVMKNYFTSVWSKNRPYSLVNYNQSITRNENRRMQIVLSSKEWISTGTEGLEVDWLGQGKNSLPSLVAEIPVPHETKVPDKGGFGALFSVGEGTDRKVYALETQTYMSGLSLCVDALMPDSASAGTYVRQLSPNLWKWVGQWFTAGFDMNIVNSMNMTDNSPVDTLVGIVQDWHMVVDSARTGALDEATFFVGNTWTGSKIGDYGVLVFGEGADKAEKVGEIFSDYLLPLPLISDYEDDTPETPSFRAVFAGDDGNTIWKDNMEKIGVTFQFEPFVDTPEDVRITEDFLRCAPFSTAFREGIRIVSDVNLYFRFTTALNVSGHDLSWSPVILLTLTKDTIRYMEERRQITFANPITRTWDDDDTSIPGVTWKETSISIRNISLSEEDEDNNTLGVLISFTNDDHAGHSYSMQANYVMEGVENVGKIQERWGQAGVYEGKSLPNIAFHHDGVPCKTYMLILDTFTPPDIPAGEFILFNSYDAEYNFPGKADATRDNSISPTTAINLGDITRLGINARYVSATGGVSSFPESIPDELEKLPSTLTILDGCPFSNGDGGEPSIIAQTSSVEGTSYALYVNTRGAWRLVYAQRHGTKVRVSAVNDRSREVIDSATGDPAGRTKSYKDEYSTAMEWSADGE